MSFVIIDDLRPGMVLEQDAVAPDGRVLLKSGAELGEGHIELFHRVGMEGVEASAVVELPPGKLLEIEDYVRDFFLYVNPDHPPMVELFRLTLERVALCVAAGWELPDADLRRAANVEHLDDIFLKDMGGPAEICKHETELESFPDIYFRIREVLNSANVSAAKLAEVVSTDISLSAKLLRLVNSPFYGFPSTIDSISRAIALVGGRELSILALGISTINYFKDIPPELVDMRSFWRHSITCGIFARILAETQTGLQPERFFIGGLLHDVGRLILFKKLPYASTEAMLFARENSIPLVEAEDTILGFNHTDVSEHLLREWQFPRPLAEMIDYHHKPQSFPNPLEPSIINVADSIANAMEISSGGMYVVPGMDEASWELLGLEPEFLQEAIRKHDQQVDQIMEAFF